MHCPYMVLLLILVLSLSAVPTVWDRPRSRSFPRILEQERADGSTRRSSTHLERQLFFGILWTGLCIFFPEQFIRFFMSPTKEVLAIAPTIFRCYGISFLLLPLNIFSTYYFQALMQPRTAFIVSVARGLVISGILIYVLPAAAGGNAVWFAMPVTELVVAVYVICEMIKYTKKLSVKEE